MLFRMKGCLVVTGKFWFVAHAHGNYDTCQTCGKMQKQDRQLFSFT